MPEFLVGLIALVLGGVAGFVAGILVGRKHASKVEGIVNLTK